MPRQQQAHGQAQRWTNILSYVSTAASALHDLGDARGMPLLKGVSQALLSLLGKVQTMKKGQDDWMQTMEKIHQLAYAILSVHAEAYAELPVTATSAVNDFSGTLQKLLRFVDLQQEGSKWKQFFQQTERNRLLQECRAGLDRALVMFKLQIDALGQNIVEMEDTAERTHWELVGLIASMSNDGFSDGPESLRLETEFGSTNSLDTFSMLPSEPKLFYGRESEIHHLLSLFQHPSPRIAILGAGGMGKTTLARGLLHHPDVSSRYPVRFFVACEAPRTVDDLVALLARHLGVGVKPKGNLTELVLDSLTKSEPCLVLLDNFETCWEPGDSRSEIEKFLGRVADIAHVALVITMRGAERPDQVQWTRPFLPPLQPLPPEAARETFAAITDNFRDSAEIDKVLELTDNLPLAIDLLAHLVESQGCDVVLSSWQKYKTTLSKMPRPHSSSTLDISIALSMDSPRISGSPDAQALLSVLSILPDGISDSELLRSGLPLANILACKSTLLRTTLAYMAHNGRLKVLVPIREYIQHTNPPPWEHIRLLLKRFAELLDLCMQHSGTLTGTPLLGALSTNIGNLQSILLLGLGGNDAAELRETVECALTLNFLSEVTGHGCPSLTPHILPALRTVQDDRLKVKFIHQVFSHWMYNQSFRVSDSDADKLVEEARECLLRLNAPDVASAFYLALGDYFRLHRNDVHTALKYFTDSANAASAGNFHHTRALTAIAYAQWQLGDLRAALRIALQSHQAYKLAGNLLEEARALRIATMCLYSLGHFNLAFLTCSRARKLLRDCGLSGADLDLNLMNCEAEIHLSKTQYRDALEINHHILQTTSTEQFPYKCAYAWLNVTLIGLEMGMGDTEVQGSLKEARGIFETLQYPRGMTNCDIAQAGLELRRGAKEQAIFLLERSLAKFCGQDSEIETSSLDKLADASYWEGTSSRVSQHAVVFLAHGRRINSKLDIYCAFYCLAQIFLSEGDTPTARSLLAAALEGFTELDVHRRKGDCMVFLGEIELRGGNADEAVELWTNARPLFERSSQAKKIDMLERRIREQQPR